MVKSELTKPQRRERYEHILEMTICNKLLGTFTKPANLSMYVIELFGEFGNRDKKMPQKVSTPANVQHDKLTIEKSIIVGAKLCKVLVS